MSIPQGSAPRASSEAIDSAIAKALVYTDSREGFYLQELREFVKIPSVSSLSAHRQDVAACAEFVAGRLLEAGLQSAEVLSTDGHPVVYGEWLGAPGRPTILLYGHYDVQPVDPLNLWETPPFEATIKDGDIFGRGVADDKGQVLAQWSGLAAHLKTSGRLPVNVKVLIEGEEEVGSPNLGRFVGNNPEKIACDAIVISDTSLFERGIPSLCYGLRGLAYFQINVEVATHDLHSGSYGGSVANPIDVVARLIVALKDDAGRIQIPGFYDDVLPLTPAEKSELAKLPFDEANYLQQTGAPSLHGERGYSTLERIWTRPTLDPNGIWGGFTGEGSKTVLPSKASAKLSCRLVPNQTPEKVAQQLESYLKKIAPPYARVELVIMDGGQPILMPLDHPATLAAGRALAAGFGRQPVYTRTGGSIPIVARFTEVLKAPTVLMGFAPPDSYAHAPNERMDLAGFYAGIRSATHLWGELGRWEK